MSALEEDFSCCREWYYLQKASVTRKWILPYEALYLLLKSILFQMLPLHLLSLRGCAHAYDELAYVKLKSNREEKKCPCHPPFFFSRCIPRFSLLHWLRVSVPRRYLWLSSWRTVSHGEREKRKKKKKKAKCVLYRGLKWVKSLWATRQSSLWRCWNKVSTIKKYSYK